MVRSDLDSRTGPHQAKGEKVCVCMCVQSKSHIYKMEKINCKTSLLAKKRPTGCLDSDPHTLPIVQ